MSVQCHTAVSLFLERPRGGNIARELIRISLFVQKGCHYKPVMSVVSSSLNPSPGSRDEETTDITG